MNNWVLEDAPLHSNIVWENFFTHQSWSVKIKTFMINFLVFLLAASIASPYYFIQQIYNVGFV